MTCGLLAQNVPRSLSREGRVLLLAEVSRALLDGRLPSAEACMFIGSALQAFLQTGGALERHLRIGAPRGSHRQPHKLFASLIGDERRDDSDAAPSVEINDEEFR